MARGRGVLTKVQSSNFAQAQNIQPILPGALLKCKLNRISTTSDNHKKILALRRLNQLPNIVFPDEKTFFVEQFINECLYFPESVRNHSDEL